MSKCVFGKELRAGSFLPKLWSDAWFLAFAACAGGVMVTFDSTLAARAGNAVLYVS